MSRYDTWCYPAPQSAELTVRTARQPLGRMLAVVTGEIDYDSAAAFEECLMAATADGVTGLDLDLRGVRFCDCAGLNALLRLRERTALAGRTLRIRSVGPRMRRLLELTGTTELFCEPLDRGHLDGRPRDRYPRRAGPLLTGTAPDVVATVDGAPTRAGEALEG